MASSERLRGLILREITSASKPSRTTALGALMGLEPLHITVTAEATKEGRAQLPGDRDNWFADGSKNREFLEAGVYRNNSDSSRTVPFGPLTTVLQTEMVVILQSARKAQDYVHGRNIPICSNITSNGAL